MAELSSDDQHLTVRHPKKRSMRFFKFNRNDWSWAFISVLVVIGLAVIVGSTWSRGIVLIAIVLWCLTMLPVESLNDRVYFGPIAFLDNLRIKANGFYTWKGSALDASGKRRRGVRIMKLAVKGFGDLGLIYNRQRDTYSMVFSAEGSPISSQNLPAQFASHQQIAAIFTKAAAAAKVTIKVSTGVRARPEDPWEFWNMIALYGEVEVAETEAEFEQKTIEDYTEYDHRMKYLQTVQFAQEEISEMSNDIDMIMVITVAGTEAFQKAVKKKSIDEEELSRQPISRIRTVVLPLLEKVTAGKVTVLDEEGAERYLRKSWDVNLRDYYDRAHERALRGDEIKPDQWYPSRFIKQFKTYLQIDDTYGATLKVTSFPRGDAFPFEARVFYAAHARYYANSVIGETQHGRWAYNFLNLGSGFVGDAIETVGIDASGPRAERREQEKNDRLKEIDESIYIQDYNPLVAVSGSSLEELEANIELETDRLSAEGMQTSRVIGERNQLNWYLSATTLIDLT
ncbi:MAG TPA: hypothetical protein VIM31_01465 [Candidatus Microsaccharimonas sp.]|jgi:hypothetical protein